MTPISLADLAATVRTIEADLGASPLEDGTVQTLTVTYRPNAFTAGSEARFVGMTPVMVDDAFRRFICELVRAWELTDTTGGAIVPLEPAALAAIPPVVLVRIYNACLADSDRRAASRARAVC